MQASEETWLRDLYIIQQTLVITDEKTLHRQVYLFSSSVPIRVSVPTYNQDQTGVEQCDFLPWACFIVLGARWVNAPDLCDNFKWDC